MFASQKIRLKHLSGRFLRIRAEDEKQLRDLLQPLFRHPEGTVEGICISPNHGRSLFLGPISLNSVGEPMNLFVKGAGLNLPVAPFLYLPKHGGTYYGLCTKAEAMREWRNGRYYEAICLHSAIVLAVIELTESAVQQEWPAHICPCLVFSATRHPLRVTDLGYFKESVRLKYLDSAMVSVRVTSLRAYLDWFAATIASSVAVEHAAGGANETLYPHNVTLAAELVDFEGARHYGGRHSGPEVLERRQMLEIYNTLELLNELRVLTNSCCRLHTLFGRFSDVYRATHKNSIALNRVLSLDK